MENLWEKPVSKSLLNKVAGHGHSIFCEFTKFLKRAKFLIKFDSSDSFFVSDLFDVVRHYQINLIRSQYQY